MHFPSRLLIWSSLQQVVGGISAYLHGAVVTRRGQPLPIRTEGDAPHRLSVTLQHKHSFIWFQMQHHHSGTEQETSPMLIKRSIKPNPSQWCLHS